MSRAPLVALKPERGFPRGGMRAGGHHHRLALREPARWPSATRTESMGETAENVAERYGVSREDQDAFALESHRRAIAAQEAGRFDDELVTVDAPQPKGDPVTVHADEGPRPDTTAERLAALRPVFREGGTRDRRQLVADQRRRRVPRAGLRGAGRASSGASRSRASSPTGAAGVDPAYMGVGPVPATRKALERAGLTIDDIDLVELNEAFAAQVLASRPRAGHPAREAQRERRRDRARPPARLLGRAAGRHAGLRATPPRRALRRRDDVHRRRPGLAAVIENPAASA